MAPLSRAASSSWGARGTSRVARLRSLRLREQLVEGAKVPAVGKPLQQG